MIGRYERISILLAHDDDDLLLTRHAFEQAQGYYFAPPLPADEIGYLLTADQLPGTTLPPDRSAA